MSDPAAYRAFLASARDERARTDPAGSEPQPRVSSPGDPGDPLADVAVQVLATGADGRGDIGIVDGVARFTDRVDELGASVAAIATRWRDSLQAHLPADPRERWEMAQVVMEFGINLEAQTGIVICSGKTAAAFKVAVTWKPRDEPPPPAP